MEVVPVLDLKHGLVVRARMGDRAAYAPIETPLAPSPEPLAVAEGLLGLHPFARLYLADLDGIEGRGRNDAVVAALAARFPAVELWVDNGIADPTDARAFLRAHRARLVIGSESQSDATLPRALGAGAVLSIDFRGETFVGPPALRDDPATWADDVIAMTLARVGSNAGPDFERLAALRALSPTTRLWAAGGVRGLDDLSRLAAEGVAGALVATALHDGRLDRDALAAIAALRASPTAPAPQ